MKYILSFSLTLSVLCTSLSAVEYGTLVSQISLPYPVASEKITLYQGDVLELKGVLIYGVNAFGLVVKDSRLPANSAGEPGAGELYNTALWDITSDANFNRVVVGPAEIFMTPLNYSAGNFLRVSYKLTRASEVEFKQVNIVSLPSSTVGAGTHEIVVESSDDLQTWTPVHSSSIGGNKAFFRTRVVEASE